MKKNLVLLGLMGVGKTTLGKIVSKKLKMEFVDTDKAIENKNLMLISEIFKKKGEKYFRLEEEKIALNLLEKKNCILALGGGTFMNKTLRDYILKNSISIWLDVNIKILNKRTKWNVKRPLLNKKNNFSILQKLYFKRKHVYNMANHKIICDKYNKEIIVKKIIKLYEKH